MKKTGNKTLDLYRKKLYQLTMNLDDYFLKEYSYRNRLLMYQKTWIPAIKAIKKSMLISIKTDPVFREALVKYLETDIDVLLWFNGFLSSPDQRKFGSKAGDIDYIIYPFQVVIAEISKRKTVLIKKSRDMGLSVLFSGLDAGRVAFEKKFESLFLSEKRDKVDLVGDKTQSLMGKIRRFIEESKIIDITKYEANKLLHLWRDEKARIDGSSMKASAANGYRYDNIRLDEAGLIKNLGELINEMMMSAGNVAMFGTLKIGTDDDFRERLLSTYIIDWEAMWSDFRGQYLDSPLSYTEMWDNIVAKHTSSISEEKPVRVDITYRDHPFKKGNCDYFNIESDKLFNNPTAIALQLSADINAGSVDRSLSELHPDFHFQHKTTFATVISNRSNWHKFKLTGGFDMGGHNGTAFVPVLIDNWGFSYVLPTEYFKTGSMEDWLLKLEGIYGIGNQVVEVYADQAINQYSAEGGLWSQAIRSKKLKGVFKFIPVSNRNMVDMRMLVNSVLCVKLTHRKTEEELPYISLAEENRAWAMSYEPEGKYSSSKTQKDLSHAHDAFIYFAYNYYIKILDFDQFYFAR